MSIFFIQNPNKAFGSKIVYCLGWDTYGTVEKN